MPSGVAHVPCCLYYTHIIGVTCLCSVKCEGHALCVWLRHNVRKGRRAKPVSEVKLYCHHVVCTTQQRQSNVFKK